MVSTNMRSCGVRAAAILVALATLFAAQPATAQTPRPSTDKGSVVFFSKVDLRWTPNGGLLQDTYLSLTNDYPASVRVQLYFVNGDPPLAADPVTGERAHFGWNYIDNVIVLTGDQPKYWSVLTGLPGGVVPFTALDGGFPPGRPAPDGNRMLRGYVIGWAVNSSNQEIHWNHLKGEGTIINYGDGAAWEYNAMTYSAIAGDHGDPTGTPGTLMLDGVEFAASYAQILMNFIATGAPAFSGPRQVLADTDVTIHPASGDFRQEGDGPVSTKANFDIWNMNEVKFSGQHKCITCWDETLGSNYGPPHHFRLMHLQTHAGKARIDGLMSQVCNVDFMFGDGGCGAHPLDVCTQNTALIGLVTHIMMFDGGVDYAAAGTHMAGVGTDTTGVIQYDVSGSPPPQEATDPFADLMRLWEEETPRSP